MASDAWRQKIKRLWDLFWSGGIANPLSAIEQISYLIFLKRLSDLDDAELRNGTREVSRFVGKDERCKWNNIRNLGSPEIMLKVMRDEAFPFLKRAQDNDEAFPKAMQDAVFIIPKASLLQGAMDIIEDIHITDLDVDTQGEIYEDLLSELSQAGKNGQFLTKRHIVRVIVELVDPQLGDYICDPSAGTGGFPIGAHQHILFNHTPEDVRRKDSDGTLHNIYPVWTSKEQEDAVKGDHFVGYDFDTTMVRLGLMNMLLHGIEAPQFLYQDTLSKRFRPTRDKYTVILTNPPFTGNLDVSDIDDERMPIKTKKTELLFLQRCLSLLDTGGKCAIIVPEGVLFGSTNAHKELRKKLLDENQIEAIISLPTGCFKPYTGVKTSIIYFTKGIEGATETTKKVWFYEVSGDGYTLDDKRNPDPNNNDLKYVPQAYRQWVRNEQVKWDSAEDRVKAELRQQTIERQDIVDNAYNLTAGAYIISTQGARDDDPENSPINIISRVRDLESGINEQLNVIETALAEIKNA